MAHTASGLLNNTAINGKTKMHKILVLGKNGQVGWELQRSLGLMGNTVFLARNDQGGDLLKINEMIDRIKQERPQIIFNAAAYTAVDTAEKDIDTANKVNGDAVSALAKVCKEIDALLIHYSTDYVFNGLGDKPWTEKDVIAPINAYGNSKALGEKAILESGCKAYIFRTSWVYGVHGKNFMKTMLRLGRSRDSLGIVADQIGAPTSAEFIADVSTWLAMHKPVQHPEVVHLVPYGTTSWYGFAKEIFDQAKSDNLMIKSLKSLKTEEYPLPAKRPLNSRLNNSKLISLLPAGAVKEWQCYALRVLQEILSK